MSVQTCRSSEAVAHQIGARAEPSRHVQFVAVQSAPQRHIAISSFEP
jgi:hypothetical protein